MFRLCILAIVRLYCKLNKQLYNMCVGYCGGNEISSYISGWHGFGPLQTGVNTLRTGSFKLFKRPLPGFLNSFNPFNAELNPICYLLALLGAHHFLHVSTIRVKSLTLRLLMSYIYGAPILDVSRSHTTTQHSR